MSDRDITITNEPDGVVLTHFGHKLARVYRAPDTDLYNERHKIVLEVADTGDACFELAVAIFRHLRQFGTIPVR